MNCRRLQHRYTNGDNSVFRSVLPLCALSRTQMSAASLDFSASSCSRPYILSLSSFSVTSWHIGTDPPRARATIHSGWQSQTHHILTLTRYTWQSHACTCMPWCFAASSSFGIYLRTAGSLGSPRCLGFIVRASWPSRCSSILYTCTACLLSAHRTRAFWPAIRKTAGALDRLSLWSWLAKF